MELKTRSGETSGIGAIYVYSEDRSSDDISSSLVQWLHHQDSVLTLRKLKQIARVEDETIGSIREATGRAGVPRQDCF